MKHLHARLTSVCGAALLVSFTAGLLAQTANPPAAPAGERPSDDIIRSRHTSELSARLAGNLHRPSDDYEERTLDGIAGRDVVGQGNEKLGEVNDVVIDPRDGTIAYVVVSSGGLLGIGDDLRVLPANALEVRDGFFAALMDRLAFKELPVVTEEELELGHFAANAGVTQRSLHGSGAVTAPSPADKPATRAANRPGFSRAALTRAGILREREVRNGDRLVGVLEEVIFDFRGGQASAVLDANDEFTGTKGLFVVPFDKLQFEATRPETIATTLDRVDFAHVYSEIGAVGQTLGGRADNPRVISPPEDAPIAWDNPPAENIEDNDRPSDDTLDVGESPIPPAKPGRIAAGESPVAARPLEATGRRTNTPATGADANLEAAGRAVRRAIDTDASVGREEVHVSVADGKLVLQGKVVSEAVKERIETLAQDAAGDAELESRIMVRRE